MGSLPPLWGQGLGGCISTWVGSAGWLGWQVASLWIPKPDASSKAIADMRRARRGLERSKGKTHTKAELQVLLENHTFVFFPLLVCPGACSRGANASSLTNDEKQTPPIAHPSWCLSLRVKISYLQPFRLALFYTERVPRAPQELASHFFLLVLFPKHLTISNCPPTLDAFGPSAPARCPW